MRLDSRFPILFNQSPQAPCEDEHIPALDRRNGAARPDPGRHRGLQRGYPSPHSAAATHGVNVGGMIGTLQKPPAGAIVVLHACCHNPTGVDLSSAQWERVIEIVNLRGLVPLLDIAYQGFAEGLDADAAAVRRFTAACPVVFVSSSFSKSLSLYGERVGALSIVTGNADEAARALSQVKRVIRPNYSNPPTHGGQAVTMV